jgi:Uma2 family endonuclease
MTLHTALTAEQLFQMDLGRCELIRGEIVKMPPGGAEHGEYASDAAFFVNLHVKANRLGKVFAAETGFIIARHPDTVRAPDVAFVAKRRLPSRRVRGYFPGPPDLAIEVVSPGDRRPAVLKKVREWLAAGTKSVWLIDSQKRSIHVFRPGRKVILYGIEDVLENDPTLPGFALKLADLFNPEI